MKKHKKGALSTTRPALTMIWAGSILALIFSYIPMLQAFWLSFQTGKGNNLKFGGLANYIRLFKDATFQQTLTNTMEFVVFQVPLMVLLALLVAVLLNDKKVRLRGFFRTCIFLPCVTSLVSCSVLFKNIFATDGLLNNLLLQLNIVDQPIPWLMDAFWSKVVIVIVLIWRWTGYYMIFYLAALQNIDPSIYEAAKIDGADFWTVICKITLPILKPVLVLTSILATNSTIQMFDEVVNLTGGGPGNATATISKYIYDLSFTYVPSYGYTAAVSYVVFAIVIVLALLQKRLENSGGRKRKGVRI